MTGMSMPVLAAPEFDSVSTTIHEEQEIELPNVNSDYSSFDTDNPTTSSSGLNLPGADSDTDDEEGGISLLGTEGVFFSPKTP